MTKREQKRILKEQMEKFLNEGRPNDTLVLYEDGVAVDNEYPMWASKVYIKQEPKKWINSIMESWDGKKELSLVIK